MAADADAHAQRRACAGTCRRRSRRSTTRCRRRRLADVCGISGLGDGGIYTPCNFFTPGASGGKVPVFEQFTTRHARLQHRLEQRRAERRRRLAAERAERLAAHAARRSRAGDDPRRLLGRVRAAGLRRVHRRLRRQSRQHAQPDARRQHRPRAAPASRGRCCCARRTGSIRRRSRRRPTYPIAVTAEPRRQHQRVPSRHQDRVGAHLDGRLPARARRTTWPSKSATSARAASTSGPTLNYNERNLIENGFFDEFKLAMANLQANNAAGGTRAPARSRTSGPAPARRRCRSTSPTSTASTRRRQSGGLHAARTWTNTGLTQDMVRTNPQPFNSAADLDGDSARRQPRDRGRPAGELLRRQSRTSTTVNVTDSGAFSDYHALQIELRRRLSRGLADQRQLPVRDRGTLGVPRASTTAA